MQAGERPNDDDDDDDEHLVTDKYGLNGGRGNIESIQYRNWIKSIFICFINVKSTVCKTSRRRWKIYVKFAVLQMPHTVKVTLQSFS